MNKANKSKTKVFSAAKWLVAVSAVGIILFYFYWNPSTSGSGSSLLGNQAEQKIETEKQPVYPSGDQDEPKIDSQDVSIPAFIWEKVGTISRRISETIHLF